MCHDCIIFKRLIANNDVQVTNCAVTAGLCSKTSASCFDLEIFR